MKSLDIKHQITVALSQSFIATVIIYLTCFISLSIGSVFSLLFFSFLPTTVYFLVAALMPALTGKQSGQAHTGFVNWLILVILSVLFALLLDRVVSLINNDVPKAYGEMFERYLIENGKVSKGIKLRRVEVFTGLPFFLQNSYTNIAGIALGVFAGAKVAKWKNNNTAVAGIPVNASVQ
jgi:uncharacterized MAPEG superfamily protein